MLKFGEEKVAKRWAKRQKLKDILQQKITMKSVHETIVFRIP